MSCHTHATRYVACGIGKAFFFDWNGFPVCLTAMPSRRCGCFSGIGRGPVSWMIFRYATSGAWRTGSGARAACGVRRAVCGLPVSAPVSGAMSFPVFVCRCRVVAGVESAWSCLRACQSGLRFCRVPVPRSADRPGFFAALFRSAGSGGGVCPAFGDVQGYADVSVKGALPGMAHGGHAGGSKKRPH